MKLVALGIDQVDNLCHDLLKTLVGPQLDGTEIEWNIEAIAPVREAVEEVLQGVYHIGIQYIDDSLLGDKDEMNFTEDDQENFEPVNISPEGLKNFIKGIKDE